jgi:hypothetical protein
MQRKRLQNGDYPLIREAVVRYAREALGERIKKGESGGDFLA